MTKARPAWVGTSETSGGTEEHTVHLGFVEGITSHLPQGLGVGLKAEQLSCQFGVLISAGPRREETVRRSPDDQGKVER